MERHQTYMEENLGMRKVGQRKLKKEAGGKREKSQIPVMLSEFCKLKAYFSSA